MKWNGKTHALHTDIVNETICTSMAVTEIIKKSSLSLDEKWFVERGYMKKFTKDLN